MTYRMGFRPLRKRHYMVANVDADGKPDGTFRCLTCLAAERVHA